MARRPRRPSAIEQKTTQALQQLGKDWAALTFNQDRAKCGPLPIWAWNIAVFVALAALLWLGTPPRTWTACAVAIFTVWTVARAATVMPRRRTQVADIYAAVRERAGLPRGTATNPPRPEGYISVADWSTSGRAADFTVTISPDAKAGLCQPFHVLAEKAVQKSVPTPQAGQEWVFGWPDEAHMRCRAVPSDHKDVFIRNHDRKMINALCDRALFDGGRNGDTHEYALTVADRKESERAGTVYHFPTKVTFHYGGFDASDPLFREKVTAAFDAKIPAPGVWIYDWTTDGELSMELVGDDDVRARRKKEVSKIIADCYTLVGNKRGMRLNVEVTKWMPDGKTHPPYFPTRLRIDFGTLNLGDRRDRDTFEQRFDTAMGARYHKLVWLYDWQPGASTILEVLAVPDSSKKARRKDTERTLRNVIESKFGSARNFVDCDVLEWQPGVTKDGAALVQTAEVRFGAVDVTSNDMRDNFQGHWDSLTTANDWHYAWDSTKGTVTITAVPAIPDAIQFPNPGTAEFDEAIEAARNGVLRFGPQKGGGWLEWDLGETPHALIGGKTGSGKALACSTPIITPTGWRRLGDLAVGDEVFDENGQPTRVTGVYDQPLADTCFKITVSDGATVISDDQHLWWTEDRAAHVSRNLQHGSDGQHSHTPNLSATTVGAVQAAAAAATPADTISLNEVARITGLGVNELGPIRRIAASIGPAEEVRVEQRHYHYPSQIVWQRQTVRDFNAVALSDYIVGRCRSATPGTALADHSTALMAAAVHCRDTHADGVSMPELARMIGVPAEQVHTWLPSAADTVPWEHAQKTVQVTVPEKTVTRHGPTIPLYPKQALLEAVAEYGQGLRWDQRGTTHLGQVRTLNEIRHTLRTDDGSFNHIVPLAGPLQFPEQSLPVAPYTLGAWLGDGTSSSGDIISEDTAIIDAIRADGYQVERYSSARRGLTHSYGVAGLAAQLRALGLIETRTGGEPRKRIPGQYLRSSEAQRRALFAGLLDTGGTVAPHGTVHFDHTNETLARQVVELARSLGYRPTITGRPAAGNGHTHETVWRASFATTDTVFRLPRKRQAHQARNRHATTEHHTHRYITTVEKVAPCPMRCISVDSPTRQFLVGDAMIPTHNSVALSIVLFYAMYLPDLYEVIVCDPKMMDFIWTAEFPNVRSVATSDVELCQACSQTRRELEQRQELLKRVQVRKLSLMRQMYRDNPQLEAQYGPVPKRLILFFDEIADFLAPGSDEDIEELKRDARADLEKIGRLGRAMEVNIVAAAQKPDAKIVSTQLRSQLGFRLGVGPLDQYESEQILNSNHGTRFPTSGTPKGRAWGYDPKGGYRQVQIMFLPDDSMTAEWDPTQQLLGTKERIRDRLTALGYQRVEITNAAGGREPRWVTVDSSAYIDTGPSGSDTSPQTPHIDDTADTADTDDADAEGTPVLVAKTSTAQHSSDSGVADDMPVEDADWG